MLKGSIRTRENLSKKFKHLTVKRQDDSINIDKDFIEMEVYSDDGGKEEYKTDNSIYTYMADNIVDIRPESIVAGDAINSRTYHIIFPIHIHWIIFNIIMLTQACYHTVF